MYLIMESIRVQEWKLFMQLFENCLLRTKSSLLSSRVLMILSHCVVHADIYNKLMRYAQVREIAKQDPWWLVDQPIECFYRHNVRYMMLHHLQYFRARYSTAIVKLADDYYATVHMILSRCGVPDAVSQTISTFV